MTDGLAGRVVRRGSAATLVLALGAGLPLTLGASASAATDGAVTLEDALAPTTQCPADLAAHVDEVPDVVVGTVTGVQAGQSTEAAYLVQLTSIETLSGDVEATKSIAVEASAVQGEKASAASSIPQVESAYVVFLTPGNDESDAFTARLCDFVPQSQQAAVETAIEKVQSQEAARDDSSGAAWTTVDDSEATDYGSAVLPGVLIAAIGMFGLAGAILLSAITGRRGR